MTQEAPTRTAAVWCPDWPVTAAATAASQECADDAPIAVLTANRVVACNVAAREQGVRRGQLRREAQYRCPVLVVLPRDPVSEARLFEPVVTCLEEGAPGVEIIRPGLAALRLRGLARYYGTEEKAVSAVGEMINALTEAWVGAADGAFAAGLAARAGRIIPAGETPNFLAPLPITVFGSRTAVPLVDLLLRLGLRTLGAFAALPASDVSTRFGPAGAWAHQMAGGRDLRPVTGRRPPLECSVEVAFEPPLDLSDAVAFSAKTTAERFIDGLARHGLTCVCFEVQADTDFGPRGSGEQLVRRWRFTGLLTADDVLDRIRWQLDGLFDQSRTARLAGAVTRLRLVPIDTIPTGEHQQALWGGAGEGEKRVQRGLARVQSQFGHESVSRLFVQGGSDPAARTGRAVWGEPLPSTASTTHPWPGHLPAPAPARLVDPPRAIGVLDESRHTVTISSRGSVSAPPSWLRIDRRDLVAITAWAGPWPASEAWWEGKDPVLRCQLVDVHGRAYVVTYAASSGEEVSDCGEWLLEGLYD